MKPTRWWGFGGSVPGPTMETRSGQGIIVEWANELPPQHFLPIDHKLHGAEADKPQVRTVVHVHGAKAPPQSDGYPDDWVVPGKANLYHYPNQQDATALWYHDHAMGINRLNIYAGMLGAFLVRDAAEDALNLPKDKHEIPLVFFDRLFTLDHQLLYPVSANPEAPWVPEVFGNAILVNGKLFPYLDVEPRKYRFRLLNASNGRFYHLSLGEGVSFFQIGNRPGIAAGPGTAEEPADRARRARRPGGRFQRAPRPTAHSEKRLVRHHAVPHLGEESERPQFPSVGPAAGSEAGGIRRRKDPPADAGRV